MMNFLKKDNNKTSNVTLKNGALSIFFEDAINPHLWQAQIDHLKSCSFFIEAEGAAHALVMRDENNNKQASASFQTDNQAKQALRLITQNLLQANNGGAPKDEEKGGFFFYLLVFLAGFVLLYLLFALFFYNDEVMELAQEKQQAAQQENIQNENAEQKPLNIEKGVPVNLNDILKQQQN